MEKTRTHDRTEDAFYEKLVRLKAHIRAKKREMYKSAQFLGGCRHTLHLSLMQKEAVRAYLSARIFFHSVGLAQDRVRIRFFGMCVAAAYLVCLAVFCRTAAALFARPV